MNNIKYWLKYCLILVSLHQYFSLDFNFGNDAIQKYTRLKILSECLGHGFVQSWKESLKSSTEKCFSEESFGEGPNLVSLLEEILLKRNVEPTNKIDPQGYQYPGFEHNTLESDLRQENIHPSPQNPFLVYLMPFAAAHHNIHHQPPFAAQHPLQFINQLHPNLALQQSAKRFWKRSASTAATTTTTKEEVEQINEKKEDREGKRINLRPEWRTSEMEFDTAKLLQTIPKVTIVRKQLGNRISNITCVLKSMELLDENGSPNYNYNTKLINRLNVPESLRTSFREAQDFCREFSMCVPIHRMSDVVVKEVGSSLVFMKCMKKMILQACVAQDMKTSMENYGLDLPELFTIPEPLKDRSAYASRSGNLFDETPVGVAKNLENILEAEDQVAFGF